MEELTEVYLFRSYELFVVADFVLGAHFESFFRDDLALDFDGLDCVCESVLLGVVFGQYFFLRVFLL